MDAEQIINRPREALETLSAEDFETASIRSAAPSYTSEAPSYHSSFPNNEAIPAYTPPTHQAAGLAPNVVPSTAPVTADGEAEQPQQEPLGGAHRANSAPSVLTTTSGGLPPVPTGPVIRRHSDGLPDLMQFRIPMWSTISHENPAARHYQRVAHRRVTEATSSGVEGIKKLIVLGRIDEEEGRERARPLEDPYLVGEEAARRARAERLARENGDEILIREDKRWDWFLAQSKDWEERDRSWRQFRMDMEHGRRNGRLARRIRG